jgi:hypothetical protein
MVGVLSDGCAFEFWWSRKPGPYEIEEIRVLGPVESLDRTYAFLRLPPYAEPSWTPNFAGYRHVDSSAVSRAGLSFIGLWHRTDGVTGSLVAAYNADGSRVIRLGTAEWAYDGVYTHFSIHDGLYAFTLVDEPEGSDPLYMAVYDWTYFNPWSRRARRTRR